MNTTTFTGLLSLRLSKPVRRLTAVQNLDMIFGEGNYDTHSILMNGVIVGYLIVHCVGQVEILDRRMAANRFAQLQLGKPVECFQTLERSRNRHQND
jgi:hypothetical protein